MHLVASGTVQVNVIAKPCHRHSWQRSDSMDGLKGVHCKQIVNCTETSGNIRSQSLGHLVTICRSLHHHKLKGREIWPPSKSQHD